MQCPMRRINEIKYKNVHYLGIVIEVVASLMERFLELFDVENSSKVVLPTENGGCLGSRRVIASLANITTTSDMVGLSFASS